VDLWICGFENRIQLKLNMARWRSTRGRRYQISVSVKVGNVLSQWTINICERIVQNRKSSSSLGEFAKLRKATIGFVMYVRPSAPRNNSAPTGKIFTKFVIWVFFENLLRKFKFH